MSDKRETMRNDARQSSEEQPAFGESAEDFGAGGQTSVDSDPVDQNRDVNRDPKLAEAGERIADGSRVRAGDRK